MAYDLEIHHVGIHAGDCTIIVVYRTLNGVRFIHLKILIDIGHCTSSGINKFLGYLNHAFASQNDDDRNHFHLLIVSHYHKDHVDGITKSKVKFDHVLDYGTYQYVSNVEYPEILGFKSINSRSENHRQGDQVGTYWSYVKKKAKYLKRIEIPFIKEDNWSVDAQLNEENKRPLNIYLTRNKLEWDQSDQLGVLTCYCAGGILYDGNNVTNTGSTNENDNSLAFILHWNGFRYYTAGDLSYKETSNYTPVTPSLIELLSQEPYHNCPLPVDVMKVTHHGSKNNNEEELYKIMCPRVMVVPCNKQLSGGLPDLDTLGVLDSYCEDQNRGNKFLYFLNDFKIRGRKINNIANKMYLSNVVQNCDGLNEFIETLNSENVKNLQELGLVNKKHGKSYIAIKRDVEDGNLSDLTTEQISKLRKLLGYALSHGSVKSLISVCIKLINQVDDNAMEEDITDEQEDNMNVTTIRDVNQKYQVICRYGEGKGVEYTPYIAQNWNINPIPQFCKRGYPCEMDKSTLEDLSFGEDIFDIEILVLCQFKRQVLKIVMWCFMDLEKDQTDGMDYCKEYFPALHRLLMLRKNERENIWHVFQDVNKIKEAAFKCLECILYKMDKNSFPKTTSDCSQNLINFVFTRKNYYVNGKQRHYKAWFKNCKEPFDTNSFEDELPLWDFDLNLFPLVDELFIYVCSMFYTGFIKKKDTAIRYGNLQIIKCAAFRFRNKKNLTGDELKTIWYLLNGYNAVRNYIERPSSSGNEPYQEINIISRFPGQEFFSYGEAFRDYYSWNHGSSVEIPGEKRKFRYSTIARKRRKGR